MVLATDMHCAMSSNFLWFCMQAILNIQNGQGNSKEQPRHLQPDN
jgi:hypothetical protein